MELDAADLKPTSDPFLSLKLMLVVFGRGWTPEYAGEICRFNLWLDRLLLIAFINLRLSFALLFAPLGSVSVYWTFLGCGQEEEDEEEEEGNCNIWGLNVWLNGFDSAFWFCWDGAEIQSIYISWNKRWRGGGSESSWKNNTYRYILM